MPASGFTCPTPRLRPLVQLFPLALCVLLGGCELLPWEPQPNQSLPPLKPAVSEPLKARHAQLVGRWYGEATTRDGLTRRWLRENLADGRYRLNIRDYRPDGSILQQTESGRWGLSGTIYFTLMEHWHHDGHTRASNPADPYHHDAYEIIRIDGRHWHYRHQESRQLLIMERVDDRFHLPGQAP